LCQGGYSSMNIDCHKCHARYHMDPALFKGAKGIRVRCRRCGNSLYFLSPVRTASDRNVVNDTSFSRDPSDNSGIEPAVFLPGQEQSTPPEMEWTLPVGEPAPLSQENGEEVESWEEIFRKPLPGSAYPHAPLMWSSVVPRPGAIRLSRNPRKKPALIFLCVFLFLVVGGSAYLYLNTAGKGMLSGIGQALAAAIPFFRS